MAGNINIYVGSQFLAESINTVFLAYINPIDIAWETVEELPTETYANVRKSCERPDLDDHLNWRCETQPEDSGFVFNIIALFDEDNDLLSYGILTQTQQLDSASVWNVKISLAWNLDAKTAEQLQITLLPVYQRHTYDTDTRENTSGGGIKRTHDFLEELDALYMDNDVQDGFFQSNSGLICSANGAVADRLNQYTYGNLVITRDTNNLTNDSQYRSWLLPTEAADGRAKLFNGNTASINNLSETLAEEFNASIRLSDRNDFENTKSFFISSQNSAYRTPLQQKATSDYIKNQSNFISESQVTHESPISPVKNKPSNIYINDIVGIYITPVIISILVDQNLIEDELEISELATAYRDASLYFDPFGGSGLFVPFKKGYILYPFGTKDFVVKVFCVKKSFHDGKNYYEDLREDRDFSITPVLYRHRNSYFIQYANGYCYVFDDAKFDYSRNPDDAQNELFYITDNKLEDIIPLGRWSGDPAWGTDLPNYKMAIVDLSDSNNRNKEPHGYDGDFVMTPHMCISGMYGEIINGPYDWRSFEAYCNKILKELESGIMSGNSNIVIEPWNGIVWHIIELWAKDRDVSINSDAGFPIKFTINVPIDTEEKRQALFNKVKAYFKSYVDLYSYYLTTYNYDNDPGHDSNDPTHNLIPDYIQTVDFRTTELLGITSLYNLEDQDSDAYSQSHIEDYDSGEITDNHKGYFPNFDNELPEVCQYYFDDNSDVLVDTYANYENDTINNSFKIMLRGIRESFNEFYKSISNEASTKWMFCDNGIVYYYTDDTYYYINVIKYNNIYGNPVFRQVVPRAKVKNLKISYSSGVLTLKFSLITQLTATEATSSEQTSIYDLNSSNPYSPIIGESITNGYEPNYKTNSETQAKRMFQVNDYYYGFGLLVKTLRIEDTTKLPTLGPKQATNSAQDYISTNGIRLVRYNLK